MVDAGLGSRSEVQFRCSSSRISSPAYCFHGLRIMAYPSHSLLLDRQRLQKGFASSHFTRLRLDTEVLSTWAHFGRRKAYLHVLHPARLFKCLGFVFLMPPITNKLTFYPQHGTNVSITCPQSAGITRSPVERLYNACPGFRRGWTFPWIFLPQQGNFAYPSCCLNSYPVWTVLCTRKLMIRTGGN